MPILAALAAAAAASTAPAPEIRFCPAAGAWTYPLDDQRRVRSLVLQSVAITNPSGAPIEVKAIEIDLLAGGEARDTRRFPAASVAGLGAGAPAVEAFRAILPSQFCNGSLMGDMRAATSATVAAGEALVIVQQTFAWSGNRDAVRVTAHAVRGGAPLDLVAQAPIRAGASKTTFRFPLSGTWTIGAGPSLHSHHRWAVLEEYAYDILKVDAAGKTRTGDGSHFTDYLAYGAPVLAAADGVVAAALDGVAEDPSAMIAPGETGEVYLARLQKDQAARIAKGPSGILGNHVVIDHGNGEFSLYAHLKPGSVKVKPGQTVRAGEAIAALGSSGNSTEPHLHFQVCDTPDPLACAAIPVRFTGVADPQDPLPHTLQTGDVVTVK